MLNNWFKKEKPFAGFAGFGGGATGLAFSGSLDADGHTATGGLISDYESNGEKYRAHVFTSSGSFDVTALSSASNTVDVILVGGGGAGGSGDKGSRWSGAGGGAGATRVGANLGTGIETGGLPAEVADVVPTSCPSAPARAACSLAAASETASTFACVKDEDRG